MWNKISVNEFKPYCYQRNGGCVSKGIAKILAWEIIKEKVCDDSCVNWKYCLHNTTK